MVERPDVFTIRPWGETDDPVAIVADLVGTAGAVAVGDHTWARFVLDLQAALPAARFSKASAVTGPLRAVKEPAEVEALRRAAAAVDRIAADLQAGKIPLVGRTEADVSADLGRRIVDEGHQHVNFAIVAAGENAASPHHEAGARVIRPGEVVLCDFGGTMLDDEGVGWCSDITRCVHVGEPPAEVAEAYAVLHEAQRAATAAATVGTPCEAVDAAARDVIAAAGYGDRFIHRTGHGIGVEEHEDPYIVVGQRHAAGARAMRSRSSRASTCPAGSACASRTSSSPPTRVPTSSTGPTTPWRSSTSELSAPRPLGGPDQAGAVGRQDSRAPAARPYPRTP